MKYQKTFIAPILSQKETLIVYPFILVLTQIVEVHLAIILREHVF